TPPESHHEFRRRDSHDRSLERAPSPRGVPRGGLPFYRRHPVEEHQDPHRRKNRRRTDLVALPFDRRYRRDEANPVRHRSSRRRYPRRDHFGGRKTPEFPPRLTKFHR